MAGENAFSPGDTVKLKGTPGPAMTVGQAGGESVVRSPERERVRLMIERPDYTAAAPHGPPVVPVAWFADGRLHTATFAAEMLEPAGGGTVRLTEGR